MDHALRTISYIADIGDLVVLMARRRMITQDGEDSSNKIAKTPKMVCHVFESEEVMNVDCVVCSPSPTIALFCMSYASRSPFLAGPVYCPVYRPGLSSCLHGIPQSQWHRRPEFRTRNGLPGSVELSRDIRRRTANVCQERAAERGTIHHHVFLKLPPHIHFLDAIAQRLSCRKLVTRSWEL